ncbi:hypothetical protein NVP1188A_47 [Vibrio phage 1.188.A._10N.286.51.A6]|uniref:Coil containing protein n=3 Tax=Mukerjeevirus mv51A6 TaxID=2734162 RepID=A0A2I7RJ04_9CAUD|nr:tail length tape measure protein [Vibrio phage 1.188.A._10N.286.51.A6]AUR93615.1 hypothetical protein NVP1188A_47 [Vibrio phage 1.188.A._10N.286.51.A6]AUR93701.1 hypothetical protein NVP1188B_47 [Vibrio phage 1.188.B._10N.286.51.A6]AUR93787.1 hypothetical protein NVP1188C_47 [Vibrio phage 1.188.C._10N.286.51.A6]
MGNPSLDDVVAMDEQAFADFANTFDAGAVSEEAASSPSGEESTEETTDPTASAEEGSEETTEITDEETTTVGDTGDGETTEGTIPEGFYDALTAPFKAAGKEVSFTDPEEMRTLMKKGIGFEQRMGSLKKFERHMNALDKQGILNDDTINLVIELAQGKPEALKQYIEKNNIDVYDVIGIDNTEYSPEKHVQSEEEFQNEQVVQEIQSLDGYEIIKPLAEDEWDDKSREQLLASPELAKSMIRAANAGVHDMILVEAEKVKLLASVPISDFDAYMQAGDKLHKSGAFDKIAKKGKSNVSNEIKPTNVAPQTKQTGRKSAMPTMAEVAKMTPEQLAKFAAEHNI